MFTSVLSTIQNQLNFYGYTIALVFGSIGSIFILILFNQQRHNACSIYLVNSAMINLLYLATIFFLNTFYVSYDDQSTGALIFCKFSSYIRGFLGQTAKTILIFVCIDRYMITSRRVALRALSTTKRAKYLVFFNYIFWAIIVSHHAIFMLVIKGKCVPQSSYSTFLAFYSLLFNGVGPSGVLVLFASLTCRNLSQMRRRVQPFDHNFGNRNQIFQRRDRDLLVLVIAEVVVYIITTALLPVTFLEMMISGYILPVKSLDYNRAEMFTLNIAFLLMYFFSAAPFYIYIVASASFRRDFRQLMVKAYRKLRKQARDQSAFQTN